MNEKKTSDLNRQLQQTTTNQFHDYLETLPIAPTLKDFFSSYIAMTNMSPSRIIEQSHLSTSYGYSILNGEKQHPSRNVLLSLCLGAQMDLDTTQHALRIAKLGELYAKVPRDAAIMIHINQKEWNVVRLNTFLDQEGLELIQ